MAKAKVEEREQKLRVLEEGRILGAVARHRPEVMEKLEALAAVKKKKKIEIVSEALDLYYEMQTLEGLWEVISSMRPEQLRAAWQLFRYFMMLARDIYVDMGKEFVSGTVAKYMELIESARREGYEAARASAGSDRVNRILEKLDPVLDALVDWIVSAMFPSRSRRVRVPVEVVER